MHLTKTEKEVFQALSDGDNSADIAAARFRSKETIYNHIANVRDKLGARTIAHAVKLLLKQGLIYSVFYVLIVSQGFPVPVRGEDDPREDDKRRLRVARTFSVRAGRVKEDLV